MRIHSVQRSLKGISRHTPGSRLAKCKECGPVRAERSNAAKVADEPVYLSDMMTFESDVLPSSDPEDLVDRATEVLGKAETFLSDIGTKEKSQPAPSSAPPTPINTSTTIGPGSTIETEDEYAERKILRNALDGISFDEKKSAGSKVEFGSSPWADVEWEEPPWAQQDPPLAVKQEEKKETQKEVLLLEKEAPQTLDLLFQTWDAAEPEASTQLPPLESVVELTSASKPPKRGEGNLSINTGSRVTGDGQGVLADGTKWEQKSGAEKGENGLWKRWKVLKGVSDSGKVVWEESWWETSDWSGYKELGAVKSGKSKDGGAWHETWTEKVYTDSVNLEPTVERIARKWSHNADGNEWEEKWGEYYQAGGNANKWADKWAKEGMQVWHEKWGEDYDGCGGCVKWTDKWAEALTEGGKVEWGDKWEEKFKDGEGTKTGETWNASADGSRYQRWWGERHFGNGNVQKYGNSTTGETWDTTEQMDTYYNPIPHFGFSHAISHSPQLLGIPVLPKDDTDDGLGPGIGSL